MILGFAAHQSIGIWGMRIDGSLYLIEAFICGVDLVIETRKKAIDVGLFAGNLGARIVCLSTRVFGARRG